MSSLILPRANVYDLRNITPPPQFRYYLDTNILKFVFARTPYQEKTYQTEYYPAFYKKLLRLTKPKLFTFAENVLELVHVLDSIEKESLGIDSIKAFRRENLKTYLDLRKAIYEDIKSGIDIYAISITPNYITDYFNIDFSIDLKDYIFFRFAADPQTAFVTDDAEFINIDGINVFTANGNAINNAKKFNRLQNE